MSTENQGRHARASLLSTMLAFACVGGFVAFLIFLSNGLLLYVMLGVAGFGGFGLLHYLLWGHVMSQQVAAEREEVRLEAEARRDLQ